jgi:hypothetical protein
MFFKITNSFNEDLFFHLISAPGRDEEELLTFVDELTYEPWKGDSIPMNMPSSYQFHNNSSKVVHYLS